LKTKADEDEAARKESDEARIRLDKSFKDAAEKLGSFETDFKKISEELTQEKLAHAALKKKVAVLMS